MPKSIFMADVFKHNKMPCILPYIIDTFNTCLCSVNHEKRLIHNDKLLVTRDCRCKCAGMMTRSNCRRITVYATSVFVRQWMFLHIINYKSNK